jgi:hypothetical protein
MTAPLSNIANGEAVNVKCTPAKEWKELSVSCFSN